MKKMVLFFAVIFLTGITAQATDHKHSDHHDRVTKRYQHAQPIIFIQGGIKFFVYPEGGIDYKILRSRTSPYRNWSSHGAINTPGGYYGYSRSNNRFVQYDYYGRLKKVGSNYISYDRYDRVRRIGSVNIRYNRRGLLYQVGGLHIYYNRYNTIKHVEGNVHYDGCGYCGINGCTITHAPYYNQNWKPRSFEKPYRDHYYKNRKRKKRYHHNDDDDDDDYDDDDDND